LQLLAPLVLVFAPDRILGAGGEARRRLEISFKSGVRIAKFGSWRLEATDTEPENLDKQVREILSRLTQDLSAWQALRQQFEIDLFCGWFIKGADEGVEVSAAIRSSGPLR